MGVSPFARLQADPAPIAPWSATRRLRDGDAGTRQSIDEIRDVVWASLRSPVVRLYMAQALEGIPEYDKPAEARAIFDRVHSDLRWTDHPIAHQLVQQPEFTLAAGIGNCTDMSVLLAAMLMQDGIPCRLITLANDPADPESFAHVYIEADINGQWVPVDAARPGATFGTTVERYWRKHEWDLVSRQDLEVTTLQGSFAAFESQYPRLAGLGAPVDWYGLGTFDDVTGDFVPYGVTAPTADTPPWSGPGSEYSIYGGTIPQPGQPGYSFGGILAPILNTVTGIWRSVTGQPSVAVGTPAAPGAAAPAGTVAGIPTGTLVMGGLLLGGIALLAKKR